ncbi:SKP1-like protein 21 [Artemisia annua]|uniref:SKP1-like protein 21 n=1 Tax=Artemisia annua TaxID=35608 RepID=A0A2U1LTI5_ARTAN|nr:SKP1-like protein 21 [Artemisia annua]
MVAIWWTAAVMVIVSGWNNTNSRNKNSANSKNLTSKNYIPASKNQYCTNNNIELLYYLLIPKKPRHNYNILYKNEGPSVVALVLDFFYSSKALFSRVFKGFQDGLMAVNSSSSMGESLTELLTPAKSLQMTQLVDLLCGPLVKLVEISTDEEIRQAFGIPDDITEEDKWTPIQINTDNSEVRLFNKLCARKRKEIKQKEKMKNVEVEAPPVDNRSIDDLMSFINGENEEIGNLEPNYLIWANLEPSEANLEPNYLKPN